MKPENDNFQEINLSEIVRVLQNGKKTIIYFVIGFFLLALMLVFFSETLYTSTLKFIPQVESETGLGGLGGMASLAGISLGGTQNSTSFIPASMYPTIVEGIPFKLQVLDKKLFVEDEKDSVSVRDYFNLYYHKPTSYLFKKYTLGILSVLRSKNVQTNAERSVVLDNGIIQSSSSDAYIFGRLDNFVTVEPGGKQGFTILSVSMPTASLASQMNQICMEVLQKILIEYKIATAQKEFFFLESQYQIKKEEYEQAQSTLARFKDNNQGLISAAAQTRLQRLQYEFDLSFSLYSEMAKNLEQARIKISKDTPIFSVIDPVVVPRSKSHPNVPFYLVGFLVLGTFLGIVFVYARAFLKGSI
jgi:hypothetical protein